MSPMRSRSARRSDCPAACALDILGDRWTLLVIRDLFFGKSRYGDFLGSPEGIPTNILAERLERLQKAGLVESSLYQENPPRQAYALTAKGRDLGPVLRSLARWGRRHVPNTITAAQARAMQKQFAAARAAETVRN